MKLQTIKKRKTADIVFAVLLAAGIAFLIWKIPYGFHFFDETYYYTLSYRLLQGDAFFVDDWSFTQFSLISLYPFVKLYCSVTGGTEGLIIAGRYFFVFVHSLCALGVYLLVRKNSPWKAICAAMLYFLYTHWNMTAQSYYQISVDMLLISMLFVAAAGEKKQRVGIGGYFFAISVLACPYIAAAYLLYTLLCIALKIIGKEKKEVLNIKTWLYFTAGCAVAAVIFFAFFFWKTDIKKIPRVIPLFFDNYQPTVKTARLWKVLFGQLKTADFALLAAVLFEAADRKRLERRKIYASATAVIALLGAAAEAVSEGGGTSRVLLSFSIVGLNAYILCRKKDRKLFFLVYLMGWFLGLCIFSASDTNSNTMLMDGWVVSAAAGLCFIIQLTLEMLRETEKRMWKLCVCTVCAVVIAVPVGNEAWLKKNRCFCETALTWEMYCSIDEGIGKGEKTWENVLLYEHEGLRKATEKVRNAEGEYVLYFSDDSWPYLEDTKRCAAYTVWMQTENDIYMAEKLLKYWEIFPEKKPDAIYVTKNNEHPLEVIEIVNTENFPVEENDRGYEMVRPK